MPYGLTSETIERLQRIFSHYGQISEVILYGSRAKGTYTEGSDIDLTLKGEDIDFSTLQQIMDEIDNLLLPWLFDLSIYSKLDNKDILEHIDRVGISMYNKK